MLLLMQNHGYKNKLQLQKRCSIFIPIIYISIVML